MKKYILLFCLWSLVSTALPKVQPSLHVSPALYLAIAQGNTQQIQWLLNRDASGKIHPDMDGNSPLMEAIIALGEKLMEMETASLAKELSNPKHLTDDFRSFLRSIIVSLIIAVSASEIQSNIERINNEENHAPITMLQSIARSFLPVIARSAYIWCGYSILDYGIIMGQKNPPNQSTPESSPIEKYKETIDVLLATPTIDINQVNHHGESALSLIRQLKDKIKSGQLKIIIYEIEQMLLHEGAYNYPNSHSQVQNYAQETY
jgi:hypothetical protein